MADYGSSREAQVKAAGLLERARAGDPQAKNQLYIASRAGGWRPGDRNAAVNAWNALDPSEADNVPHINRSHGFLGDVGKTVGGGLKKLAPLAAFIPGVGPLAAAGIAGLANTAGGLMKGEGADLKGSLLDAGLAGLGNKFLVHHAPPAGQDAMQADSLVGGSGGTALQSTGMAPRVGLPQQLLNQFKNPETGQLDFGKLAQVGGAGLGIMEKRQQRNAMERLANSQLGMQRAQIQAAEQRYAEREPLRQAALARLGNMHGGSIFGTY